MKTPDEVPILYLSLNSIRELNTVHIAHTCPARPFTEKKRGQVVPPTPFCGVYEGSRWLLPRRKEAGAA